MISSKKEYRYYCEADRIALSISKNRYSIKLLIFNLFYPDYRWKYQKLMRRIEYRMNCKSGIINKIFLFLLNAKFQKLGLRLLINIYPNTCGPGLSIAHTGPIRISKGTKIGANCRIHISTNIGIKAGTSHESANIGDNVYIGPGTKFVASCEIANNIAIGANSVITKNFIEEGSVVAGIPARIVKKGIDTRTMLIPATELIELGVYETNGETSNNLFEKYFNK